VIVGMWLSRTSCPQAPSFRHARSFRHFASALLKYFILPRSSDVSIYRELSNERFRLFASRSGGTRLFIQPFLVKQKH
jgi:hypothetical protein